MSQLKKHTTQGRWKVQIYFFGGTILIGCLFLFLLYEVEMEMGEAGQSVPPVPPALRLQLYLRLIGIIMRLFTSRCASFEALTTTMKKKRRNLAKCFSHLEDSLVSFEKKLKCAIRSAVVIKYLWHNVAAQKQYRRSPWRIFANFGDITGTFKCWCLIVHIL